MPERVDDRAGAAALAALRAAGACSSPLVAGLIGFSVQWGEGMPRALYVGLAVGAIVLLVALGFRYLMARVSSAS